MCKKITLVSSLLFSIISLAQSQDIAVQNFDDTVLNWSFTSDITFFNDGSSGFYGIHNGDAVNNNDTGLAFRASWVTHPSFEHDFLFIHDLQNNNGLGTSETATIQFEAIDISDYHSVNLSLDFQSEGLEQSEFISLTLTEDGVDTYHNIPLNQSGNLNIPLNNSTHTAQISLHFKQNALSEFIAIDNIKLSGVLKLPCADLYFSEYVEGQSSNQFNNNYIELYNASNQDVSLEPYQLTIYTNQNTEATATLSLQGAIPAYGTYLIEDNTELLNIPSNFSTNSLVMNFNGDDKIALLKHGEIIDLIGAIGDSTVFAIDVTLRRKSHIQLGNNQFNINEWDVYGLEKVNDLNLHTSNCSQVIPEIEILGNQLPIVDGDTITSVGNNTHFGITTLTQGDIQKSFIIKNTGNADLIISNLDITSSELNQFEISNPGNAIIAPNDSTTIDINFNPLQQGYFDASVNLMTNDNSESTYQFKISAEVAGNTQSPLIISQYYENGANKWIEIKNISGNVIEADQYFLSSFLNQTAVDAHRNKPSRSKAIPQLNSGETALFRFTLNVSQPAYAFTGSEIATTVCSFDGNDIIIISTNNTNTAWHHRLDIIGNTTNWGENLSMVRKNNCGLTETKSYFDLNDWNILSVEEVISAESNTNERLGVHLGNLTVFNENFTWSNGEPNIHTAAIINQNYDTALYGSFEACSLTINSQYTVNIEPEDWVTIENDLEVYGTLRIQNNGNLIMKNNNGTIINQGQISIFKTADNIQQYDYTYWSSPVEQAILNEVFHQSPQNSFYTFNTAQYADINHDNQDDDNNVWQWAQGEMLSGIGYTALAPNSFIQPNSQRVEFMGTPHNGIYHAPISLSGDENNQLDDWNLIGNPYPSTISIDSLHHYNSNLIGGTFYFWTHNTDFNHNDNQYSTDDYSMYSVGSGGIIANSGGVRPNECISSAQGFFVEALSPGTLEFRNEMRMTDQSHFYKTEQKKNLDDKIWINLSAEKGSFSQILIAFLPNATSSYEPLYDGVRLESGNKLTLYSLADNQKLAIQGLEPFNKQTINLGLSNTTEEVQKCQISIADIQGLIKEQTIYLKDKELNLVHNLTQDVYSFEIGSNTTIDNRFELIFNDSLIHNPEQESLDYLIVTNQNDLLHISTSLNSKIQSATLFDMLGRVVWRSNSTRSQYSIDKTSVNASGIYILQSKLANGKSFVKKVWL